MKRVHSWKHHAHRGVGFLVPAIAICLVACCLRRRCKRRCHEKRQARERAAQALAAAGAVIPSGDQYPGNVRVNMPVAQAVAVATPVVYSHNPVASYVVPAAAASAPAGTMVEMRSFPSPSSPVVEGNSLYPSIGRNGYARVGAEDEAI